jgi:hypothetical protein
MAAAAVDGDDDDDDEDDKDEMPARIRGSSMLLLL